MGSARPRLSLALAVVVCVTAAGCSVAKENSQPERPAETETHASAESRPVTYAALSGVTWRPLRRYLRDYSPPPPPNTGEVEFQADGHWTGYDGCNGEGGRFYLSEATVTMKGGPVTDMGCANFSPSALLDGADLRLDPSGSHLTALDADGQVVVEYSRVVRWACGPQDRRSTLYDRGAPPPGVSLEELRQAEGHRVNLEAVVARRNGSDALVRVLNSDGLVLTESMVARWPNGSWGVHGIRWCRHRR